MLCHPFKKQTLTLYWHVPMTQKSYAFKTLLNATMAGLKILLYTEVCYLLTLAVIIPIFYLLQSSIDIN